MKKIFLLSFVFTTFMMAKTDFLSQANENAKRVAPSKQELILSFHDSIKDVKHAVVNIATSKKVKISKEMELYMKNPLFRQFFPQAMPRSRKTHSLGSGVIITNDGYILTNNHVVDGADEIYVSINGDDKNYKAKLIGTDPKTDIAVVKIDAKNLTVAKFADSSKVEEGDVVFAIGDPFGVGTSVTQGIVSALNKSRVGINQYENFIQTDASINPGNSGGALVDSRGALIGINSAILSKSGGNNGIGFAIPSNMAKNIALKLIEFGKVERGYLGVSISDLTKNLKNLYKSKHGAVIVDLLKGNAADKAGLKRGDLIVSVNNQEIKNANQLKNLIATYRPNREVNIKYEREKKISTVTFKLGSQDSINGENFIDGLKLSELTPTIRERLKIPSDLSGVLVTDVKLDSKAEKDGFLRGDIIIQVEDKVINSIKDLDKISKTAPKGAKRVYVNRNGYIVIIVAQD